MMYALCVVLRAQQTTSNAELGNPNGWYVQSVSETLPSSDFRVLVVEYNVCGR